MTPKLHFLRCFDGRRTVYRSGDYVIRKHGDDWQAACGADVLYTGPDYDRAERECQGHWERNRAMEVRR